MSQNSLHELVRERSVRTPGAVAIACAAETIRYADLEARSNRLASLLIERGAGPEMPVAIKLPRSADQVVALLAAMKTGGYCVPVDDEHPADRVATMLADAEPVVLVTRERTPRDRSCISIEMPAALHG